MSDRIDREIDDILRYVERRERRSLTRRIARLILPMTQAWQASFASFLRRSPVEQFMIASILLVLISFLLQFVAPRIAFYASALGVLLFVLAIGLSVAGPRRSSGYEKRWRGRPIDYSSPSIWWQLRRWFQRRR